MTLNEFIQKYNGVGVDTDGAYGYQCMDLMHRYIMDVCGLGIGILAAPTAYQAYLNGDSHFTKTANTPTGVPQAGDIMFWNTSVGSAGHVAIFVDGDTNTFRSFDQNWPTGSVSHIQSHNYNGVAGWLRLKGAPAQGEPMVNKGDVFNLYTELLGRSPGAGDGDNWVGQTWNTAYYGIHDSAEASAYRQKIQASLALVPQLQAQVADLTKQVTELHVQLSTQTGDTTQLNALGTALQWFVKRLGLK